jgi:hypothetical protein
MHLEYTLDSSSALRFEQGDKGYQDEPISVTYHVDDHP